MEEILIKAVKYAVTAHQKVNGSYDDAPYSLHLALAAHYGERFSHLLPQKERDEVLAAIWLHDTIEDCRLTYNEIKAAFGEKIAELVFAVTNNKGRSRQERADRDYYREMTAVPFAGFLKLCDRLANAAYSRSAQDKRMLAVYESELDNFLSHFPDCAEIDYRPMKEELKQLLSSVIDLEPHPANALP